MLSVAAATTPRDAEPLHRRRPHQEQAGDVVLLVVRRGRGRRDNGGEGGERRDRRVEQRLRLIKRHQ